MEYGNIGSQKARQKTDRSTGTFGPMAIPTSTPQSVIVKSYKMSLYKTIATVKTKNHFDEDFPLFLRGKIEEDEFKRTIEGVNWFSDLLHEAEVEYFAEKFSGYEVWKSFRETLTLEETRRKKLLDLLVKEGKHLPSFRERIKTEDALKAFYDKVSKWLQSFIEDENIRVYLPKGVQWYSPDKNHWKWLEIQILPEAEPIPSEQVVKFTIPEPPEFGLYLEFKVGPNIESNGHTEYLIELNTNVKDYYPYTKLYSLRRYNDFKTFHQQLKMYMYNQNIDIRLPDLPEPKVLGRKSKSTVSKRAKIFQGLLNFIASEHRLQTCHLVLEFFGINTILNEWKYSIYADKAIRFK